MLAIALGLAPLVRDRAASVGAHHHVAVRRPAARVGGIREHGAADVARESHLAERPPDAEMGRSRSPTAPGARVAYRTVAATRQPAERLLFSRRQADARASAAGDGARRDLRNGPAARRAV